MGGTSPLTLCLVSCVKVRMVLVSLWIYSVFSTTLFFFQKHAEKHYYFFLPYVMSVCSEVAGRRWNSPSKHAAASVLNATDDQLLKTTKKLISQSEWVPSRRSEGSGRVVLGQPNRKMAVLYF